MKKVLLELELPKEYGVSDLMIAMILSSIKDAGYIKKRVANKMKLRLANENLIQIFDSDNKQVHDFIDKVLVPTYCDEELKEHLYSYNDILDLENKPDFIEKFIKEVEKNENACYIRFLKL